MRFTEVLYHGVDLDLFKPVSQAQKEDGVKPSDSPLEDGVPVGRSQRQQEATTTPA